MPDRHALSRKSDAPSAYSEFAASLSDAETMLDDAILSLEEAAEGAPKGPESKVARRIAGWAVALDLVRSDVRRLHGQVAPNHQTDGLR
jgi:hypothetical protein